MSVVGNRFYFICVLVFICYASLAFHEIIDSNSTGSSNEFGAQLEFINRSVIATELDDKQYCRAPRVAVLISPLIERFLQLYWDVEYIKEGDWVGLFRQDPQSGKEVFPIYSLKVHNTTGYGLTNITYFAKRCQLRDYTSKCLGFWAAYFTNNGTAAAVSCLKTNPTWMYDMHGDLESVPIKRMFIPGTHDSGAYFDCGTMASLNVVDRFVYTQDVDVLTQLIYGIRYLDLRISANSHLPEKWWVNHGVIRVQPLKDVLNDVKKFLHHTKEIVILDFHGFPTGFSKDSTTHKELVHYLKSELVELIAPPDWNSTCGELWSKNKTLIISYNDDDTVKAHSKILWSPVIQKWANAQSIDDLRNYLTKVFERFVTSFNDWNAYTNFNNSCSRPSYSWAAMAELTPTFWTILSYPSSGLREMAANVNIQVTNWFRGVWGRSSNIVAVDFFRGTDIVDAAIEWNVRKHRKHICDIH